MNSSVASQQRGTQGLRRRKRRSGTRWQLALMVPAALFLAVTAGYPLARLVQMSVSEVSPATLRSGSWDFVGLANFAEVVADPKFGPAAVNTVVYTAIVLAVSIGLGYVFALALSSMPRLGRGVYSIMLLVWLVPPIVSAVTWKFLLSGNGVINDFLLGTGLAAEPVGFLVEGILPLVSVALVNAWVTTPFATIILRAALLDIPQELHEQASVDGATRLQKIVFVITPLLRPTFLVLGVLIFVYAFKSFDFIFAITQGGPGTASTTLPFLSYRLAFANFEYSAAAAVAVITMLLVVVAAIPYVRAHRKEDS